MLTKRGHFFVYTESGQFIIGVCKTSFSGIFNKKTEFAEKVELQDMVLTENNAVLSKSVDSWIHIPYSSNSIGNVFCKE